MPFGFRSARVVPSVCRNAWRRSLLVYRNALAAFLIGRSRRTSFAFLSARSPLNAGCRIFPSLVHSVNATSQTSCGLTQCALRASAPSGGGSNGQLFCAIDVERPPQLERAFLREAGADPAAEDQLPAFVVADQQRADARARAFRIGEAADHELLLADALGLDPVAVPAWPIGL